jgi:hypothetical protein
MPDYYWPQGSNVKGETLSKIGSARTFGIELEISDAYDYEALDGHTVFGVKSDGSVNDDGLEFVSPILSGDEGLAAVAALCEYAKSKGWSADDSCGFHLHVGVTDLTAEQKKRIVLAYRLTQDLWFKLVTRDRHTNDYCRALPYSVAELDNADWYDLQRGNSYRARYNWVNCTSPHGTIEIRLHHGTIDKTEITNWVVAHVRFVEAVVKMTDSEVYMAFNGKGVPALFRELEGLIGSRDTSEHFRRVSNKRGLSVL